MQLFVDPNDWLQVEENQQFERFFCSFWDRSFYIRPLEIKIYLTKNKEVIYNLDGAVIRIDQVKNISYKYQILTNRRQIRFLNWIGSYGQNGQKIGYWAPTWLGEALLNTGGMYLENGTKNGFWKELITNYGMRHVATRLGNMRMIKSGGGKYDEQGLKNGLWTELNDLFWIGSQLRFKGQYKNGKKIGQWDIIYSDSKSGITEQIGGGFYDKESELKIGRWTDISEWFNYFTQIIYIGVYNNIGQKVGRWETLFKDGSKEIFEQMQQSGGFYDENSVKIGKWIELHDYFALQTNQIYYGEYNKQGKHIGLWNIDWFNQDQQKLIGGGIYDEGGSNRIGRWVEFSEFYSDQIEISYLGEYNKFGKKQGKWKTFFKEKQIGGGDFNGDIREGGDFNGDKQIKVGRWIVENNAFNFLSSLSYQGEYNENGLKVGIWDNIKCVKNKKMNEKIYPIIGQGFYSYDNQYKQGKWREADEYFTYRFEQFYTGEYNKRGIKVGKWIISQFVDDKKVYQSGGNYDEGNLIKIGLWKVGGLGFYPNFYEYYQVGQYNNSGQKVGRWLTHSIHSDRLKGGFYKEEGSFKKGKWSESYRVVFGLTWLGEYDQNGQKVGIWDLISQNKQNQNFLMASGLYDGNIKIGKWKEVDEFFSLQKLVLYEGYYNHKGIKVGQWDILFNKQQLGHDQYDQTKALTVFTNLDLSKESFEQIGGGLYNEQGEKIGRWTELNELFSTFSQKIYTGEYKNGQKFGYWETLFRYKQSNTFQILGGGHYDEGGIRKIGRWIEQPRLNFDGSAQYVGEYNQQGKKFGRWDVMIKLKWDQDFKKIDGGLYGYEGTKKIGKWIEFSTNYGFYYISILEGEYNSDGKKVGKWKLADHMQWFK